jgi:uncharacterized protein YkwD
MHVGRRWCVLLCSAGLLASMVPSTVTAEVCWDYRKKEKKFHRKINNERTGIGLRRVEMDPQLSKVARQHTRRMVKRYELYHTNNLGEKVTHWRHLGENIGDGPTVRSVHNAFMGSVTHRTIILKSNYRYVGVGTKKKYGLVWVTEVFESKRNPGTTLNMPHC